MQISHTNQANYFLKISVSVSQQQNKSLFIGFF